MALPTVRKSGRIKTRKKSSLLSNDFEYDERKFDMEEEANFEVDVSGNISNLLHSHSKEASDENLHIDDDASFPNVLSKLNKGDNVEDDDLYVNISNLVCPLCNKHLSTTEELESHIVEHQADNEDSQIISCDICGKMLTDINSYKRHIKLHTGDRPFQCGQCEKNFADSCSLRRHLKSHEEDRPFSCEICHKSFRDTASIGRHMLTHTDRPRMFQCSLCDKNFTDKSGLKRHERTHSGLRPYSCDFCLKTFIDAGSFKRHQKIHIGVRNHHCPRCNRSFMEKQSLVRHQKTVCKFGAELADSNLDEDDSTLGNGSHISNDSQDNSKDSSNHSFSNSNYSAPIPPTTLTQVESSDSVIPSNSLTSQGESPIKGTPSLRSLIQKDPGLYDSISEIVDSIDSYEKMLDLCGDRGQTEIDAALKRDIVPMPSNLLCFECGELLVDGVNFKSEGKTFNPSMTNAFKCLNCEDNEEDDYGEPPVLMPQYDVDTENNSADDEQIQVSPKEDGESTENFYGTDEPMEQFRERLKTQHGVYFIDDGYPNHFDANEESTKTPSRSNSTDSERSSKPPVIGELPPINDENIQWDTDNTQHDSALSPGNIANEMKQSPTWSSSDLPKMEYEADDPTIPSVFPCHLCTKVFASSSFLAQHLDLHKRSPHKCMVCTKTFTSGPALKRHMRLHTGEKPYACPICKKQFRDPSNFGKHKKNCCSTSSVPSPSGSCSTNSATSSIEDQSEKSNDKKMSYCNGGNSGEIPSRNVTPIKRERKQSMHFDYDEMEQSEEKVEESFPVMTVTPCIDDDIIDQSPDRGNQEKDEDKEKVEENEKEINYIPCEICQKLCESEQQLEMHMNYHTGNPDVTCIECGKSFADPFGMKRHMRIHAGIRPYTCDYCGRGYCDNWSLKKHKSKGCLQVEVRVPTDFLHPCTQCSRVFCDLEYLEEHMKVHRGLLKYECDVCKKRFSEAFNLKKHRRLHMAICPGCGQEFRNMKLLTAHQASECTTSTPVKDETEVGKSFSCNVCGRVYSTRAYLDRHRKIHSELKPHQCEICNKRFSEAFKLRRHKKTAHSDLKPFLCPDCGKCFSDDAALKRHAVSSSCALSKAMGEPISSETCVCQLCDKVFQKNYMLVRHMTVHSQDRPFSCDVCGRSYKDTSSLKRHQMIHQGVKDFICPICGKDFYYSDSLKRHMSGRCGKKTKGRRRKAATKKGKKRNYPETAAAMNNDFFNDNNNDIDNVDEMLTSIESWKNKLHTSPYISSPMTNSHSSFPCHSVKKARIDSKWSCQSKRHCWLCDVKAPSTSDLMSHRRIHQHKKRFSCQKCFIRFHKKIYWRAHFLTCRKTNKAPVVSKLRLIRKRNVNMVDPALVISDEVIGDDGERKRPRRSVPRAQWSWISQI